MLSLLQAAKNLKDLAPILGYQPSTLAYILYTIPDNAKYSEFRIPKKSGGERIIHAPNERLKALQSSLANVLEQCATELLPVNERERIGSTYAKRARSHGFKQGLSIVSNASMHTGKRNVLNVDLSDFFPSINFGRVRGFFIKNRNFSLDPQVATILAQIACHENKLPQGSPCSPTISNLIAEILDVRLTSLAKKYGCTYTRYADDLTFSTNLKSFPPELAFKLNEEKSEWQAGKKLIKCIESSGYNINHRKTRVQYKDSQQIVTGLVVNRTPNVRSKYYRTTRSMCHSLFRVGSFNLPSMEPEDEPIVDPQLSLLNILTPTETTVNVQKFDKSGSRRNSHSINQLEGMLSFILQIKKYRNKFSDNGYRKSRIDPKKYPPEDRCNDYHNESHLVAIDGIRNLYSKFLFFKHFYFLKEPLIWCEGKTDKIYLKCAIRQLSSAFPLLLEKNDKETKFKIKFFNQTKTVREIMNLAEGTSGMKYIIVSYKRLISKYNCAGKAHPVILVIDNDEGATEIFKSIAQINPSFKDPKSSEIDKSRSIYHITDNLYAIFTPRKKSGENSKIEDLFDEATLGTMLEGKSFNTENTSSSVTGQYGKAYFAENVVLKNEKSINFENFKVLLERITEAIAHYSNTKAPKV